MRPDQRSNNLKGPRLDYNYSVSIKNHFSREDFQDFPTEIIIIIIIIIMLSRLVCIFVSSLKSSSLITKVETRPTSNAKSIIP